MCEHDFYFESYRNPIKLEHYKKRYNCKLCGKVEYSSTLSWFKNRYEIEVIERFFIHADSESDAKKLALKQVDLGVDCFRETRIASINPLDKMVKL